MNSNDNLIEGPIESLIMNPICIAMRIDAIDLNQTELIQSILIELW